MRIVLAAVAIATLATGCLTPSAGRAGDNGRFPDSALVTITPSCRVVPELADSLRAMMFWAGVHGVTLVPETSSFLPPGVPGPPVIESCYRSYAMQVWWRNYYCSIGRCGLAAAPGTSKHGWGHGVDFQDQLGELTPLSPGFAWLQTHAATYGFSQPPSVAPGGANEESWHWEAG